MSTSMQVVRRKNKSNKNNRKDNNEKNKICQFCNRYNFKNKMTKLNKEELNHLELKNEIFQITIDTEFQKFHNFLIKQKIIRDDWKCINCDIFINPDAYLGSYLLWIYNFYLKSNNSNDLWYNKFNSQFKLIENIVKIFKKTELKSFYTKKLNNIFNHLYNIVSSLKKSNRKIYIKFNIITCKDENKNQKQEINVTKIYIDKIDSIFQMTDNSVYDHIFSKFYKKVFSKKNYIKEDMKNTKEIIEKSDFTENCNFYIDEINDLKNYIKNLNHSIEKLQNENLKIKDLNKNLQENKLIIEKLYSNLIVEKDKLQRDNDRLIKENEFKYNSTPNSILHTDEIYNYSNDSSNLMENSSDILDNFGNNNLGGNNFRNNFQNNNFGNNHFGNNNFENNNFGNNNFENNHFGNNFQNYSLNEFEDKKKSENTFPNKGILDFSKIKRNNSNINPPPGFFY